MFFVKKYGIYALVIVVSLGLTLYPNKKNEVIIKEEPIVKEEEIVVLKMIKIDIKGAVKKPGVYEMVESSRVIDAISIAGGLKTTADTTNINLSMILSDQMVVVVRTKDELIKKEVVIEYVELACINETGNLISINTASIEELDSLPGIGLSKAEDIISYRTTNGLFKSIEGIKNVTGIGDNLFDQIKTLIKI